MPVTSRSTTPSAPEQARFWLPRKVTVEQAAATLRVSFQVVVDGLESGQLPRHGDADDLIDGHALSRMFRTPYDVTEIPHE